jgi:16S rRNA (guanine527-N7)-methyltransferase
VPERISLNPEDHPLLTFASEDWNWLRERCTALRLPDPEAHRARFEAIYSHLHGVNQGMNLTRIHSTRDWLKQHLLDSLSFLQLPLWQQLPSNALCLDLGSGGGYPGLPLMTMHPQPRWVLVDSRGRKVAFLQQAITLTGCTNAEARQFRGSESASAAPDLHGRCQMITARAVAQADQLLRECQGLLAPGGVLVLAKGPAYHGDEAERAQATARAMSFAYEVGCKPVLETGDPERLILLFSKTPGR